MVALIRAAFTLVYVKQMTKVWMIPDDMPGPTPQKCTSRCLRNPFCGGFQYVPNWEIPCFLMVHQLAAGSDMRPMVNVKVFKKVDLEEGSLKLYGLPATSQSFNSARQDCLDRGMELVPFTTSPRDIITMRLTKHDCFWVDLQRQNDDTYSDAKGEKKFTDAELGLAWKSGEPTRSEQKCVVLCGTDGTFELEDRLCDGSVAMAVHCVMKV